MAAILANNKIFVKLGGIPVPPVPQVPEKFIDTAWRILRECGSTRGARFNDE